MIPQDIELVDIPEKAVVPEEVKVLIQDTKQKIIDERERKGTIKVLVKIRRKIL